MLVTISPNTKFSVLLIAVLQLLFVASAYGQQGSEYAITIEDPNNRLGSDRDIVKLNFLAALNDWAQYLNGVSKVDYEIRVLDHTPSGRFGGRSASAAMIVYNGQKTIEEGAAHKMRTGEDANGTKPDVIIDVEPEFMRRSYWIDPEPFQRKLPVPRGKIDLITAFAHELGHAYGINGRRDRMTGQVFPNDTLSMFDVRMINPVSNAPAFRGPITNALYGGDLPLTYFSDAEAQISFTSGKREFNASISKSQNFYHYGRYTKPNESPLSLFGLMAGAWPYTNPAYGLRIPVGRLDVAILRDLGVPTR